MKALILLAALVAPVMASQSELPVQERCELTAEFAKDVMTLRQGGYPLPDLLSKVSDGNGKRIVIAAYSKAIYSGDEWQQKVINEFRDNWFLMCYKAAM